MLKSKSDNKCNIAYKYRIYPTEDQKVFFAKNFGCCRKIWNLMLNDKINHYKATGKMLQTTPAQYKETYPYLREVDSFALCNVQMNLQTAYNNFFTNKKTGFPKFKSAKHSQRKYTTNNSTKKATIYIVDDKYIRLPKIGLVKAFIHRKAPANYILKAATISEEPDGSFYASVLYEYEDNVQFVDSIHTHIGLDYKSDGLYTNSLGECANMPHWFRNNQKKLAKAQRKLAKKQHGSKNYGKQKHKIAKINRKTANQRADYLHKKSKELTDKYELISVEDLNMKGISRSLKLGKATMDNGYGLFLKMLEYKQRNKGHYFIRINKWYPSSQLCQCGYKNPTTKDLKVRTVVCPKCGAIYDRDENAAINIDNEGLRVLYEQYNIKLVV
ncbi:MAG: RNA-guided endonuclease TnpB family protein [Acutalibacteraceae bacterium]|nr:RNA-guided endonuclease TnpB family protein [Acutalibacteraceae bacterium]